ncbi:MAG: heme ABC transporter permease [Alphaproteobacteria bacterium]
MMFQRFANPHRFNRLSSALLPWFGWLSALLIAAGLYLGFFASPPDYQQGETVRIMYIHVPSAVMAMFIYSTMAVASAVGLIWKHPLAHVSVQAAAPIGAGFTLVCLVTGSLWGKPMWGAWWVWDARLTSVLVLFFLYLGYMALRGAFDDPSRGERAAAILVLVGSVNVPIIKFSVNWWNTLHQGPSLVRADGPAIDPSMMAPLALMGLGFTFYFFALLLVRMKGEMLARRARALTLARLHAPAPATATES